MKTLTNNLIILFALVFAINLTINAQEQTYLELPQGWSIFGYVSTEEIDVVDAFSPIVDKVIVVKDNSGNAYLPEWNFDGIGNLIYSRGYQIKVTEEITDFQFSSVITSSLDYDDAINLLQENLNQLADIVMSNEELEWINHSMQDDQMMILQTELTNALVVIEELQENLIELFSVNVPSESIHVRQFNYSFDCLDDEIDTLYISELIGEEVNGPVSIEIVNVKWISEVDQDIIVEVGSLNTPRTRSYGSIEVRGNLEGETQLQRYPRSSSGDFNKTMGELFISAENPYLLFRPYSYIGTGGDGSISFWVTYNFD